MSEEGGFGVSAIEKLFGLIMFAVGAISAYYTFTSTSALGTFTWFFGLLAIILCVIGFFLITAKPE